MIMSIFVCAWRCLAPRDGRAIVATQAQQTFQSLPFAHSARDHQCMPAKENLLGADGKKLIRRLAASFAECSADAKAYGACVSLHFDSVQKGACETEFRKLQACFRKASAKARSAGK